MNFFDWLITAPDRKHLNLFVRSLAIIVVISAIIFGIAVFSVFFIWIMYSKSYEYSLIPLLGAIAYLYTVYRRDMKGMGHEQVKLPNL